MSAYCNDRWKLYRAWCTALRMARQDPRAQAAISSTRLALEDHHRVCPICKEHARAMLEMSREALCRNTKETNKMDDPEFELDTIEKLRLENEILKERIKMLEKRIAELNDMIIVLGGRP
jgi:hypothetical protein